MNPDLYNTFNGDRYDFPYILERLKLYNLPRVFGRFPNIETDSDWKKMQSKGFWSKKRNQTFEDFLKLFSSHKSHKGKDDNFADRQTNIRFAGRISVDGLPWFLRDKLDDYSLKGIINKVLKQNFNKYETLLVNDEPDTEAWIDKVLLNPSHFGKVDLPYSKIASYSIFSPKHRYALAYYCYMDSVFSWKIMRSTNKIELLMQTRASTGVDSYTAQNGGQQCLAYSRLSMFVDAMHFFYNIQDWYEKKPLKYEGGVCFPTVPGQHFGVVIIDFSSLYPTMACLGHISYDTLAYLPEMKESAIALQLGIRTTSCKISKRQYHWVQTPHTLLSVFYQDLFARRQRYKKLAVEAKDPAMKIFYEAAELDAKLQMNALYGFEGTGTTENSNTRKKKATTTNSEKKKWRKALRKFSIFYLWSQLKKNKN